MGTSSGIVSIRHGWDEHDFFGRKTFATDFHKSATDFLWDSGWGGVGSVVEREAVDAWREQAGASPAEAGSEGQSHNLG